jgi:3-carboxy-cis,cis-muconate cycloisomerase
MKPSSSTSNVGLAGPLFTDAAVATAVDDHAFVRAMLAAEAALALSAADCDLLPRDVATAIAATCDSLSVDIDELGSASVSAGNPVVPLVRLIGAAVPEDAKPWVHVGATSQDIIDTALMLISKTSCQVIVRRLAAAADVCASNADRHRDTVMVARTLGQQAAPTTFGRKAAGWLVGLDEAAARLTEVCDERLAVQLGGPVGTLAALGNDGQAVVAAYAERLGLKPPLLPWHTDRQRVLDLAAALGGAAAAVGKIATDIVLMAQTEIGEARLAAGGGSSSLPHKHNPIDAILVRAGAVQVPGLVATLFATSTPDNERATGSWHGEWQPWRELLNVVGGMASRTADLLPGLQIDADRMQANLDAGGGLVMAESVAARLTGTIGRSAAHELVTGCVDLAATSGQPFADVLAADPTVTAHLDPVALARALDPAAWLGSSEAMVDKALQEHRLRYGAAT